MTIPYQSEPGCSARQRQLEQQVHDLTADRSRLETDLGHARQRAEQLQVGAIEREALLADARDLLEPWGGHGDGWPSLAPAIEELIGRLNAALVRAERAEASLTPATCRDAAVRP